MKIDRIMNTESSWDDPSEDDARIVWGRSAYATVEPYGRTGRYVDDVTDAGPISRAGSMATRSTTGSWQ